MASAAQFYEERFGIAPDALSSLGCVVDTDQLNAMKLLDLALDSLSGSPFDVEHTYSAIKGAMAIMALSGPALDALERAVINGQSRAGEETALPPVPKLSTRAPKAGSLSAQLQEREEHPRPLERASALG